MQYTVYQPKLITFVVDYLTNLVTQVDVEFSIIDLARDIANYLIGSELTPTEKDVGTVSGHTSATGGDESTNEETNFKSTNEDTNYNSNNEDKNYNSINEETNYKSINEETNYKSTNEDTNFKSTNEDTNYKSTNEDTNFKSTNEDTNYNSNNEDTTYNSNNEDTTYKSNNEYTNYKDINEETNYKSTNVDTNYNSTNEDKNYNSINEKTDYDSANEDTNYKSTNEETNYKSANEDTNYETTNEDTNYETTNEDTNYETTNEETNYKSANEETNENTDNEYQFTGRFKSWEINDEVKPTWPIYHDKAYGNDRYIFDLKRPHDIRKEQRRHSHEKIDGRYDHGKNHGRYHHGRHHHGRHHHGRHHESKDHGQYKHDTGYGRYYHGEDYGGNHGEIDYGSLDEELIGEITEAADMPATSFAEIINRRLNNSPIPKFSAINYWKFDHAQNATLDEPREVVIEEVPTSASHLTSVIAPDFIDTPLKVPAIDLLLNLTSEESKGEILTNTAAQLITDTATDKETKVKSSQQEEYMDYPNLKLDSSVQDGSEDPTIVEHIPEIPELPKPDVTEVCKHLSVASSRDMPANYGWEN